MDSNTCRFKILTRLKIYYISIGKIAANVVGPWCKLISISPREIDVDVKPFDQLRHISVQSCVCHRCVALTSRVHLSDRSFQGGDLSITVGITYFLVKTREDVLPPYVYNYGLLRCH